jgi:hypothetical protein
LENRYKTKGDIEEDKRKVRDFGPSIKAEAAIDVKTNIRPLKEQADMNVDVEGNVKVESIALVTAIEVQNLSDELQETKQVTKQVTKLELLMKELKMHNAMNKALSQFSRSSK